MKRSKKEFDKLADWWFDLSKITFASLAVKLFESNKSTLNIGFALTILFGLTATLTFARIGVLFTKQIKP